MILFLIIRDLFYLIKILCYHNGCKFGKTDELAEEEIEPAQKIQIYNDTRATVISLYNRLHKHMKQEEIDDEEEDADPDFFHI